MLSESDQRARDLLVMALSRNIVEMCLRTLLLLVLCLVGVVLQENIPTIRKCFWC